MRACAVLLACLLAAALAVARADSTLAPQTPCWRSIQIEATVAATTEQCIDPVGGSDTAQCMLLNDVKILGECANNALAGGSNMPPPPVLVFGQIAGFTFVPGKQQKIVVRFDLNENPPQNSPFILSYFPFFDPSIYSTEPSTARRISARQMDGGIMLPLPAPIGGGSQGEVIRPLPTPVDAQLIQLLSQSEPQPSETPVEQPSVTPAPEEVPCWLAINMEGTIAEKTEECIDPSGQQESAQCLLMNDVVILGECANNAITNSSWQSSSSSSNEPTQRMLRTTLRSDKVPPVLLYGPIEGFEYEPGVQYRISVRFILNDSRPNASYIESYFPWFDPSIYNSDQTSSRIVIVRQQEGDAQPSELPPPGEFPPPTDSRPLPTPVEAKLRQLIAIIPVEPTATASQAPAEVVEQPSIAPVGVFPPLLEQTTETPESNASVEVGVSPMPAFNSVTSSPSASGSAVSTGAIVGIVVGSLLGTVLLAAGIVLATRRYRRDDTDSALADAATAV